MKYLLAFVALLIGFLMVKKQFGEAQKKREEDDQRDLAAKADAPPVADASQAREMVACAHCGIYSERATSLTRGGKSYCSAEHLQADIGGPT
jgi:uncharacterized protein